MLLIVGIEYTLKLQNELRLPFIVNQNVSLHKYKWKWHKTWHKCSVWLFQHLCSIHVHFVLEQFSVLNALRTSTQSIALSLFFCLVIVKLCIYFLFIALTVIAILFILYVKLFLVLSMNQNCESVCVLAVVLRDIHRDRKINKFY